MRTHAYILANRLDTPVHVYTLSNMKSCNLLALHFAFVHFEGYQIKNGKQMTVKSHDIGGFRKREKKCSQMH